MTVTRTLVAAALALSLTTSGAHALMEPRPDNNGTGLLIGAAVLGLIALLIATTDGGDGGTTSTKNGPALDLDLPNQGGAVLADF